MRSNKLLVSSYAPFWHNGSSVTKKSYDFMLAALPAVIFGIFQYGIPALAVVAFSVSCAMLWELLMNLVMKRPVTIGDGNAALIGLLFAMLMPATLPWWVVIIGTFAAIIIGKIIYGGIGCNPFNPTLVAVAILLLSWKGILRFDEALVNYDFDFYMLFPLGAVKHFGAEAAGNYSLAGLIMGNQVGGIGSTFGLGLIVGGIYLILRGHVRWEIPVSFLAGIFVTGLIFNMIDSAKYAQPLFHIFTGYTLIGAFFLAPEDSSSPVNFIPMLIYGAGAGILTILVRNLGAFTDGVVFTILLMNVANPLIDKIRPKALGRGIEHA